MEGNNFSQYLDANDLYGLAISLVFPTHGFKWISKNEEFTTRKTAKLFKKNKDGYILQVNVEESHDIHNKLSFVVEKIKIKKVKKLVPNHNNK